MSKFTNQASYERPGSSTPVMALKIFGYSVLAGIMSLFLYFSITMIADGALKMPIAYREYEVINGEQVLISETPIDPNVPFEPKDEAVTDDRKISGQYVMGAKNAACAAIIQVVEVLQQILMAAILVIMTGYYIYSEGDRDRNLVKHHGRRATPWRGLIIGLLAAIPSAIVYALLIVGKCGVMSDSVQGVYRLFNPSFTLLINVIMPVSIASATDIAVWQLAVLFLLLLVLPATGAVAYKFGYKRVFKKKKKKV